MAYWGGVAPSLNIRMPGATEGTITLNGAVARIAGREAELAQLNARCGKIVSATNF